MGAFIQVLVWGCIQQAKEDRRGVSHLPFICSRSAGPLSLLGPVSSGISTGNEGRGQGLLTQVGFVGIHVFALVGSCLSAWVMWHLGPVCCGVSEQGGRGVGLTWVGFTVAGSLAVHLSVTWQVGPIHCGSQRE